MGLVRIIWNSPGRWMDLGGSEGTELLHPAVYNKSPGSTWGQLKHQGHAVTRLPG